MFKSYYTVVFYLYIVATLFISKPATNLDVAFIGLSLYLLLNKD